MSRRLDHDRGETAGLYAAAEHRAVGMLRRFRLVPFLLGIGLAATAAQADNVGVTVIPRFERALPNLPGQNLSAVEVEVAPGAVPAPHHHAGSVYVYVLSGTIRLGLKGEAPRLYHAGESFFEPPGSVHAVSDNPSKTEPARLLAVFVAPAGAKLTTDGEGGR
jgi:quercetin dioxygenase-like cupin family protein